MELVKSSACVLQGRYSLDQVHYFKILDLLLSLYKKEKKEERRRKQIPLAEGCQSHFELVFTVQNHVPSLSP